MNVLNKIIIFVLIQTFLLSNCLYAADISERDIPVVSTLSPQIAIDINAFKNSYNDYVYKSLITDKIILPQGLIDSADIMTNGVIINDKTMNFKINENSLRIPNYFSGRVARLHITEMNPDGFLFQKMGIGVGRRKKTIAVVLVDLNDLNNQLFIFAKDNKAVLKVLNTDIPEEVIALGSNKNFAAIDRQDSFLERSDLGIKFADKILGISGPNAQKAQQVVKGLSAISSDNHKLKKDLPINLAFFSQDYMLSFSENLVKYSHVAVLRDREQRGRYIAIVDKLNTDNFVVFERRGDQVFILGKNERLLIPKLEKQSGVQVIYFSALPEGAEFCRDITRDLIQLNFADKKSSMTLNKQVQLNIGAYNNDASILKVNQVTQATLTGYQIKHNNPDFAAQEAAYPVYILRSDFNNNISVTESDIDYESSEYVFFDPDQLDEWPQYLSYNNAENAVYYQHINGIYTHSEQAYVAYKAIGSNDILTYLSFNRDNSFTIRGIDWKNGKPVVFRNVKNIALANIVTQLRSSEFIIIDPVLDEHFNMSGLEPGFNPIRSTYIFKDNCFEQGKNVKMKGEIDFSEFQKKEDKKIRKADIFSLKISKSILVFSVFSIVFAASNLFAGQSYIFADPSFFSGFIESAGVLKCMGLGAIISSLIISGIGPMVPSQPIGPDKNQKDTILGKTKQQREEEEKRRREIAALKAKAKAMFKSSDDISISDKAKLLSANHSLIEQINNSFDEQGKTFFSLKARAGGREKIFVIRSIESEQEIDAFQQQLGLDRNFKWKKIFKMIEYFRQREGFGKRFCVYGVFALDESGREQQIVAAADYIIREIDGQVVLNGAHIEVLPEARKQYSGIGKILFTKVLSDAFTMENLRLTLGRKFFVAENKGKEKDNDPVGFYKQVLGLKPQVKIGIDGKTKETIEFALSLEDSLDFLKREFAMIGFSPNLKISNQLEARLDRINLNVQEIGLINQAI